MLRLPSLPSSLALRRAGLLAVTLIIAGVCAAPGAASVAPPQASGAAAQPAAEAPSGGLMLRTAQGEVEAVRLGTDVDLAVSGPTVRARVTQAFRNTTAGWVEAVYVFPLPEDGAVDSLKLVVGDRIVVGNIKKREEAKAEYEAAREAGQTAGLVEQERANVFTSSVANIGPGETVLVQIEYQAPVRLEAGVYSLRTPLVVAPRYSPPPVAGADPVPDRARITPPVADPKGRAPNPVSLSVSLQPGFALGEVRSAYHPVVVTPDRNGAKVRLQQGLAPANRDFELTWRAASTAPAASLFRERVGGRDFLLAYVTPPAAGLAGPRLPREVVLVIDNSGSMAGESMPQAKASLDYALSRLRPEDRFNVVRFDDTFETLFTDTVPANREHLARARAFVAGLEAEGGTEMLPAMRAALTDPRPGDGGRLRQVVFVTDGAIGDEQALLNELASRRGRSRVFTVGIGSAPNSYLMTRVAEIGRGVFTHIGAPEEVETDMRTLFDQIESPVLTDVRAEFTGVKADITPETLPDLYAGQPLVLAARLSGRGGTLRLTGQFGGHPWSATLVLSDAVEGAGVSKLWARRKITDAEVARTLGKIDYETADARVLELALAHGLVTELTSLVAVDRTPRRPPGARLSREELPLNLPAGWDFDALFSGPAPERPPAEANATRGADGLLLPETATDAELRRSLGLLMVALALALSVWIRRRRLAVA